jgi:hypothetical protein
LFTRITIVVAAIWVLLSMASLKILNERSATAHLNPVERGQPTTTGKSGSTLPGMTLPGATKRGADAPGKATDSETTAPLAVPPSGGSPEAPPPAAPEPAAPPAGAKSPAGAGAKPANTTKSSDTPQP